MQLMQHIFKGTIFSTQKYNIGVNLVSKVCAFDTPHAACHTRMLPRWGLCLCLILRAIHLMRHATRACRLSEAFINHISAPAVRKVYRKCRPQETKHQRCERCV